MSHHMSQTIKTKTKRESIYDAARHKNYLSDNLGEWWFPISTPPTNSYTFGSNQPEMAAYRSRRQPRLEKSARGQGAA